MAALAEAFVRIRPDTSTFKPELEKGVDKGAAGLKKTGDKHGKIFGTAFVKSTAGPLRGLAGVVGPPVAAAFAVIGGAKLFTAFIAEAREAQKTGAQTAAVIKSTGGAAKISASQVGSLATSISNKVGVDDEAIQSGANLLLTFTNIRNEAGKGNAVFDQATATVTDMAAAMNNGAVTTTGLKAASIQVGKALNDPIKGMTALAKVGVTFSAGQKEQIATLIKHHDRLGAQKIILAELNKEFGGSAQAGTTAGQKLGVVFGNIEEQIGTALLPVLDKVENFLSAKLPGALTTATRWFNLAKTGVQAMVSAFQEGDVTSDGFVGKMEQVGVIARQVFDYIKNTAIPTLVSFGSWVVKNQGWLVPLAAGIAAIVVAVKVWIAVTKAFTIAQAALNVVLALNPIGIIILLIIGLAAAFVVAYKRSETFRDIVNGAFNAVKGVVMGVFNWIKDHWKLLLGILTGPIGAAVILIATHWAQIKTTAQNLWTGLKAIWTDGVNGLKSKFLDLVGSIIDGAVRAFGWFPGLGDKLRKAQKDFRTFRDSVNDSMNGIKSKEITVTAKASVLMGQGLSRSDAIATTLHRAMGGPIRGPGGPTGDRIPAMLSDNEHVWSAREVAGAGGHSRVAMMRKMAASGRIPGFAAGGAVRFDVLAQTLGLPQFRKDISTVNRFATDLVTGAARRAVPSVSSAFGGGGSVARWLPVVLSVLAALGQPAGLSGAVLRRIAFESGGNPNAINLTDSNARAGHPSQGLTQTIPGTFNAYAGPYRGRGITDPFANIYAGMNYALHRYGSIAAIDPLVRPRGYDNGGALMPGRTLVENNTGRPEQVRTADSEDRLERALLRIEGRLAKLAPDVGREVHRNISKGARA